MTSGACVRLPGAPKTISLANSLPPRPTLDLPPSPCVRVSRGQYPPWRSQTHPGRTLPRPHPAHSFPGTRKNRHSPAPPVSNPVSYAPHAWPTSSPRLRNFFPPIHPDLANSPPLLNYPHIRAILAHTRNRPRGPVRRSREGGNPGDGKAWRKVTWQTGTDS